MKDEDLINKFKDKNGKISPSKFKRYCNEEDKEYLKNRYPEFLDYLFSLKRIFYHIDILPKCEYCGKTIFALHQRWCNQKCQMNDPKFKQYRNNVINQEIKKEKFEKTCLNKFGTKSPLQNKEIKDKISDTNIKKYGVKNILNAKCIQDKIKKIFKEKYGVDNPGQIKEVKDKIRQTNLNRYGVNCSWKRKEVKEKTKQTFLSKYGIENYMQSDDFLQKSKETCLEKYGVEQYTKTKEFKDYITKNKNIINNKIKNTFLNKYGVEYAVQLPKIKNKIISTKRKNNTFNTSKPEEELYLYIKEKYPSVIRQYKDKERYPYCCDFYISELDLFLELNGTWTHGGHPFNSNSIEDQHILQEWKSKNTKYYDNAIKTWTIKDVEKRETAKINNLNFKEVWSLKEGKEFINELYFCYKHKYKTICLI